MRSDCIVSPVMGSDCIVDVSECQPGEHSGDVE